MTILSRIRPCCQLFLRVPTNISKYAVQYQSSRNFQLTHSFKAVKKRKGLAPTKGPPKTSRSPANPVENPDAVRPLSEFFIYTALAIPTIFTGCIIWQYENLLRKRDLLKIYTVNLTRDKPSKPGDIELTQVWRRLGPGRQLAMSLTGISTAIFVLWKFRRVHPFLIRYFSSGTTKAHSLTAGTLSAVSHVGGLHLSANMMVCFSMMAGLGGYVMDGKEQILALFLGGATFGSLASTVFKVVTGRVYITSLGASGGILTLMAYLVMASPESRFSIMFLSSIVPHSFSGMTTLGAVALLDIVGLVRGWKHLDHAAHLGGLLFGVLYSMYGQYFWQNYRKVILKHWHRLRSKTSPP